MGSLPRFLSFFTISPGLLDYFSSGPFVRFFSSFSSGSITPESIAYRRSMLRPPSMVVPRKLRYNSCSFIGTIVSRVQSSGECSRGLRAFAFLKVKSDLHLQNPSFFCVCLRMQGKLAEISLQHLKLNDFIYVSGLLGSYEKLNSSGQPEIIYKVYVQDLNYVQRLDQHYTTSTPPPEATKLLSSPSGDYAVQEITGASGEYIILGCVWGDFSRKLGFVTLPRSRNMGLGGRLAEARFSRFHDTVAPQPLLLNEILSPFWDAPDPQSNQNKHDDVSLMTLYFFFIFFILVIKPEKQLLESLYLWQLFFGSPNEWWDNRRSKKNPSFPDFKHKDTKECLWLSPNDPPWVRDKLQLYDANMRGGFKRDAKDS